MRISIHALLAESDSCKVSANVTCAVFLSTLSLRRATGGVTGRSSQVCHHFYPRSPCGERRATLPHPQPEKYFYPRSPCGERPLCCKQISGLWRISINALLAESDSTFLKLACIAARISIHALLAESDADCMDILKGIPISIHALLAESDTTCPCSWKSSSLFLSTLSLRRATAGNGEYNAREKYFYPRSPCGERRIQAQTAILMSSISIHALLAESDVDNNLTL